MTHVSVKVLLNLDSDSRPYSPGDRLHAAVRFDYDLSECGNDVEMLLRIIFEELHTPKWPAVQHRFDWGIRYRMQGNRRLRVGDVVVVGERAWAVEPQPPPDGPHPPLVWSRVVLEASQVKATP